MKYLKHVNMAPETLTEISQSSYNLRNSSSRSIKTVISGPKNMEHFINRIKICCVSHIDQKENS